MRRSLGIIIALALIIAAALYLYVKRDALASLLSLEIGEIKS